MRLLSDDELSPEAEAVFDEIRKVRQTPYITNFWRALAHNPPQLRSVWDEMRPVLRAGELDPLVKEMIYLALSISNACPYCIAQHKSQARARGMTEGQYIELIALVNLANRTNRLATGMQVPVDEIFRQPADSA
ncbi:MAG: carboxymuconolactone decarboxylase family protein [Beijerinckiaceae bacterium]|nr:carboxymuconolactone decarboxylase family protein [Beijerinckiaceae bacterium]MCZ8301883.1 carboxymuconolactone decarboxylase family protein [Beijerinckiaceae bacterium]